MPAAGRGEATGAATRLIVLRGNAASGKTTLAATLQQVLGRGTANVGQDHLRRRLLREYDVPGGDNIALIEQTVRFCLDRGYHTIVEGILVEAHYGRMLRRLISDHAGTCHVFYLDVALEETQRRHRGRPLGAEVAAERLQDWYVERDLLGVAGDVLLDGSVPQEGLLETLRSAIGPVTERTTPGGARFR